MSNGYTATADYEHLDVALKSYWPTYLELKNEVDQFAPLSLSEFDEEREKTAAKLMKLNPTMSSEEAHRKAANIISGNASPELQFFARFSARIMTLYVTVALLSQAVCEAEINAILAVGLYEAGNAEKFSKIERKNLLEKWEKYPKLICNEYELCKTSGLYESLAHLMAQRNSWMHHKIELSVDDQVVVTGSRQELPTYQDYLYWVRRYFCLPYDLAGHIFEQTEQMIPAMMIYKRNPIPVAEEHKSDIVR